MNDCERRLLALLHCPGLGLEARNRIAQTYDGDLPPDFFGAPPAWYRERWGLSARAANWLSCCLPASWGAPGFGAAPAHIASPYAPDAPRGLRALGELAPVCILLGNPTALENERTFAVLCSTRASDADVAAARRAAEAAVEAGFTVVAGHNRPAYQQVLLAAKRMGTPAIVVLDRGLFRAFDNDLSRDPIAAARIWGFAFNVERSVALSPYRPLDGWVTPNSRRRDASVARLADHIVAIALREGGTMHQLAAAAARLGRRVHADDASMPLLAGSGAVPWEGAL